MKSNEFYMTEALKEAQLAFERDEVPIGAVLVDVKTGDIVTQAGNQTIALSDPTAHAEILVIREQCTRLGVQRLPEYDLFVTLEPCPMCASALSFARIHRVVIGALDPKSGGLVSGPALNTVPQLHHKMDIISGVMTEQCGDILKRFFTLKRGRASQCHDDKIPDPI
jgi:tRNA(adenine34) deaminase